MTKKNDYETEEKRYWTASFYPIYMYVYISSYMETMSPFVRVIHEVDLETTYKYPRVDSYVPGSMLWAVVFCVPCGLSLLAWSGCNDCNDAFEVWI